MSLLEWDAIVAGARHCPVLQRCVARVEGGQLTREAALIEAALTLSVSRHLQIKREIADLQGVPRGTEKP